MLKKMQKLYKYSLDRTLRRRFVSTPRLTAFRKMSIKTTVSYEEAVRILNSLQSNAATIRKMREQRDHLQTMNIPICRKYLESIGISMRDLDNLNVIHVSGTKGKGSTCAFVEKILRDAGFRTGLYTSPHLVHVRERIRINGEPIDEDKFATQFFEVFNILKRCHSENMPAYFKFLTLLAFYVFTKQNVDVAIIEVGIGGEYDCTNVIEHPKACGISTLDYDHISILGSKLSEIAWHKSGILKENVTAFYSPAPQEAKEVLLCRSKSKNADLFEAPNFDNYSWPRPISTGIAGHHQLLNVSLALQLSRIWLSTRSSMVSGFDTNWKPGQPFLVPNSICDSIETCQWPGRSQVLKHHNITFLLDGAHTPKSMEACAEWAKQEIENVETHSKVRKILLFQCTSDRCPSTLVPYLKDMNFSQIVSCPTQLHSRINQSQDSTNLNMSKENQLEKANECVIAWRNSLDSAENVNNSQMKVFECISDAVGYIRNEAENEEIIVLVTGSLHLVGGVLSLVGGQKCL